MSRTIKPLAVFLYVDLLVIRSVKMFKFDHETVPIVHKITGIEKLPGIEGLNLITSLPLLFSIWFDRDVVILMRYTDTKR